MQDEDLERHPKKGSIGVDADAQRRVNDTTRRFGATKKCVVGSEEGEVSHGDSDARAPVAPRATPLFAGRSLSMGDGFLQMQEAHI